MPSFLTQTEGIVAQHTQTQDVQDGSSQTLTIACEVEIQATPTVADAIAQTHAISPHCLLWTSRLSEQEELWQAHRRDNGFICHSSSDGSGYEGETDESDAEPAQPIPVITLQDASTQTVSDYTPPPPYTPPQRTELQRQFQEGYELGYRQGFDFGHIRGQDPLTRGSSPFVNQSTPAILSFWEGYTHCPRDLRRRSGQSVQEFASLLRQEFESLTGEEYFQSTDEDPDDTAIIIPRSYSVD